MAEDLTKNIPDLPEVPLTGLTNSGLTLYDDGEHTYKLPLEKIKSFINALPLSAVDATGDYTGFASGSDINVSYNWTGRTVTLTNDETDIIEYYWRGIKHIWSGPWTSVAHPNTVGGWFLYSEDGETFNWSQTPWVFEDIMVVYVNYQPTSEKTFGIRETHELMDTASHKIFHDNIGTYRVNGGRLTPGTFDLNTPTNSAVCPSFNPMLIRDEDLLTALPTWPKGSYTLMYVLSSNTSDFDLNSPFPYRSTIGMYMSINMASSGTFIEGSPDKYYNVYQIVIPVTSDLNSYKFRMVLLQPQVAYPTLASAQLEDSRSLVLGSLSTFTQEFVIHSRITYHTSASYNNVGKCVIAGVSYLTGTRATQIIVSGDTSSSPVSIINPGYGRVLTSDGSNYAISGQSGFTYDGITLRLTGNTDISGQYYINGVPLSTGSSGTSGTSGSSGSSGVSGTSGSSGSSGISGSSGSSGTSANVTFTVSSVAPSNPSLNDLWVDLTV